MRFAELLDAVNELPIEASGQRRFRRARREFQAGRCQPMTPAEIFRNILS